VSNEHHYSAAWPANSQVPDLFADPVSTTSVQLTGTLDPDAYAGELTRVAALDP
jgi:hypothetical protein